MNDALNKGLHPEWLTTLLILNAYPYSLNDYPKALNYPFLQD